MSETSARSVFNVLYAGAALSGRTSSIEALRHKLGPALEVAIARVPVFAPAILEASFRHHGRRSGDHSQIVIRAMVGAVYRPEIYEEVARTADAIVFVIDSQAARREANVECVENHRRWLGKSGR